MKGVPEEPRCGFSNAVIQILRMHGVTYDSYDVLEDEGLRQGKMLYKLHIYYRILHLYNNAVPKQSRC